MKLLFYIGVAGALMASTAFAGPNVSGGPSATENLESKQKIRAVMDAINDVNDVILSVALDSGGVLYIAKIRNGEACQESLYKVIPNGGMAQFIASYVVLLSSGPCQ